MKTLAAKHFPGAPLVPMMSTGATDGIFFQTIGIPVYGAPGSSSKRTCPASTA